jgi:hypothetical protein
MNSNEKFNMLLILLVDYPIMSSTAFSIFQALMILYTNYKPAHSCKIKFIKIINGPIARISNPKLIRRRRMPRNPDPRAREFTRRPIPFFEKNNRRLGPIKRIPPPPIAAQKSFLKIVSKWAAS